MNKSESMQDENRTASRVEMPNKACGHPRVSQKSPSSLPPFLLRVLFFFLGAPFNRKCVVWPKREESGALVRRFGREGGREEGREGDQLSKPVNASINHSGGEREKRREREREREREKRQVKKRLRLGGINRAGTGAKMTRITRTLLSMLVYVLIG